MQIKRNTGEVKWGHGSYMHQHALCLGPVLITWTWRH